MTAHLGRPRNGEIQSMDGLVGLAGLEQSSRIGVSSG